MLVTVENLKNIIKIWLLIFLKKRIMTRIIL